MTVSISNEIQSGQWEEDTFSAVTLWEAGSSLVYSYLAITFEWYIKSGSAVNGYEKNQSSVRHYFSLYEPLFWRSYLDRYVHLYLKKKGKRILINEVRREHATRADQASHSYFLVCCSRIRPSPLPLKPVGDEHLLFFYRSVSSVCIHAPGCWIQMYHHHSW